MRRKNEKPGNYNSNNVTPREYSYEDLEPSLKNRLRSVHPLLFKALYEKLNEQQPGPLSSPLTKEIGSVISQFKETIALFDTHEKLKHLKDSYFTKDYVLIAYHYQLGVLYFYLGNIAISKSYFHKALTEFTHPLQAKVYWFLLKEKQSFVLDDACKISYQMKLIQGATALPGTSQQRNSIAVDFKALGYETTEACIMACASRVFVFYYLANDTAKIEVLFSILCTSSEKLVEHGSKLLKQYIVAYYERFEFSKADTILKQFPKLVVAEHYRAAVPYITGKIDKDGDDDELSRLYMYHLEKASELGDLNARLNVARTHIYSNEVPRKKEAILKAYKSILEVQKKIADLNTPDAIYLKGFIYHLLGRIIDFGLLPKTPGLKQSDAIALAYYTKATACNFPDAYHDLATMYQIAQGTKQDLEKSEALLRESIKYDNYHSLIQLANLQLMRAAIATSAGVRSQLIEVGIELIEKVMLVIGTLTPPIARKAHLTFASLLFAKDTQLNKTINTERQIVEDGFDIAAIANYSSTQAHPNRDKVEYHLKEAFKLNGMEALQFWGFLLHLGNYLNEDIELAETCYLICQKNGSLVTAELAGIYLLRSARATVLAEKKDFLLKALSLHRSFLERIPNLKQKEQFEQCFSVYMKAFRDNKDIPYKRSYFFQLSGSVSSSETRDSLEDQLVKAIEEAGSKLQLDGKSSEKELLESFFKITQLLRKSKHRIPEYLNVFEHLYALQKNLLPLFNDFSTQTQVDLVKFCSQWPLITNRDDPLANMLILTRPVAFSMAQRVSMVFAITHIKHKDGLFEDDLVLFLLNKTDMADLSSISTAARLIYIYAITHANAVKKNTVDFIDGEILKGHQAFLSYIDKHCWEANVEDMSQIYHGLFYLTLVYPRQFSNLSENLQDFMTMNTELLKRDEAVTISNKQRQIFKQVKSRATGFEQEVLVGDRRIDICNAEKNAMVLVHGPMHYLYSPQGQPLVLNPATVLCRVVLEKQRKNVFEIAYFDWTEDVSQEQKNDLMALMFLSLGIQPSITTNEGADLSDSPIIGAGRFSVNFWSPLNSPESKAISPNNMYSI